MSTLPAVALDLSDFLRPTGLATEWVYGPARNDWLRTHPITAYADADPGEATVELRGPLGLDRDQIPHLVAFLAAVYAATEQAAACRWRCATCQRCHTNACPTRWGGEVEVPCGHVVEVAS